MTDDEVPAREYSQDREAVAARRRGADGLTKDGRYKKKLREQKAAAIAAGEPIPHQQLMIDAKARRKEERDKAEHAALPALERIGQTRIDRLTRAQQIKEMSHRELLSLVNQKVATAMEALDVETIASMTGRELAILAGIMIDKKQLLEGRPTAILSVEDRSSLGRLTQAWMREAQKRGITIEGSAEDVTGR